MSSASVAFNTYEYESRFAFPLYFLTSRVLYTPANLPVSDDVGRVLPKRCGRESWWQFFREVAFAKECRQAAMEQHE